MKLNGVMVVCQKKMLNNKTTYISFWNAYAGGHWFNYFVSKHERFSNNGIRFVHEKDHTHVKSATINLMDRRIEEEFIQTPNSEKLCVGSMQHTLEIIDENKKRIRRISEDYDVKIFHCRTLVRGARLGIMKEEWPDIDRPPKFEHEKWWKRTFPEMLSFDVNKILEYDKIEYEKLCYFIQEKPLPKEVMEYEIENYKKLIEWS